LRLKRCSTFFEIWYYIKEHASVTIANQVESVIRDRMAFLAGSPGAGHHRKDLTDQDVKFFPVTLIWSPIDLTRSRYRLPQFFMDAGTWNKS